MTSLDRILNSSDNKEVEFPRWEEVISNDDEPNDRKGDVNNEGVQPDIDTSVDLEDYDDEKDIELTSVDDWSCNYPHCDDWSF